MRARLLTDTHLFGFIVAEAGTCVTVTDEQPDIDPVEVTVLLWNGEDFDEWPFFINQDEIEIIEEDD